MSDESQDDFKKSKIDLVRAFMQVEGKSKLNCTTCKKDGGIEFTGSKIIYDHVNPYFREYKSVKIVMDKNQVEAINECQTVTEIYECYKEMEYFNS